MPKSTINWEELKQKYFLSPVIEVQDFLQTSLGLSPKTTKNGFWKGKTKGWRGDKEQFKQDLSKSQIKKIVDDPEVQKQINILKIAKQNIINSIAGRVQINNRDLSMRELRDALEVIKIELGEPTKFEKNNTELTIKELIITRTIKRL